MNKDIVYYDSVETTPYAKKLESFEKALVKVSEVTRVVAALFYDYWPFLSIEQRKVLHRIADAAEDFFSSGADVVDVEDLAKNALHVYLAKFVLLQPDGTYKFVQAHFLDLEYFCCTDRATVEERLKKLPIVSVTDDIILAHGHQNDPASYLGPLKDWSIDLSIESLPEGTRVVVGGFDGLSSEWKGKTSKCLQ